MTDLGCWRLRKTNMRLVDYGLVMRDMWAGSSVGITTDYGPDSPGSNPGGDEIFPPVQTGPGTNPASCTMGTGSFPGGKVRPGRAADHSPPSSAAVMEE